MSLKRVLETLKSIGLSHVESEVYVYLAKVGPSRARDVVSALKVSKKQLYPSLRSLERKGIVTSKPEHTTLFSALTFEELINRYVKLNVEQAEITKKTKQELLNSWRNMANKNNM
jgi:sugar-specific transcriptional regulator TrmB